ncbi:MAG: adenylate/guanylate cyclase domain-containing protein [Acidobacteria bacterium]|nr:adenylate/guanylate cyclase domain-containing protein [Acidobacteriota bacterium]
MSIRRRVTLSFSVILVLFGLNLIIYSWSGQRRSEAVEDLRRAISRQILVASIDQNLKDMQKQIALLSQVTVEATSIGASPEELSQFDTQTATISLDVNEVYHLSDPSAQPQVNELLKSFVELAASWRTFYENFGVNQVKAITELATKSDPMSERVIKQLVPQLQEDERGRVEMASKGFYDVARFTNRMTIAIFAASILIAITIAFRMSHYLTRGLAELKLGAALIGSGSLERQIAVTRADEIGDLAHAFNDMSDNLLQARNQITEANQELERRNKEVEEQKEVSESLLLNILPAQVARELRDNGKVEPKYFEDVTILFTDFVAFTLSTEKYAAEELVQLLHEYFTAFDGITKRYGLEKLKTIGDSYMCAAGLPVRNPSHPVDAVMAAFEILHAVSNPSRSAAQWSVRIGIHTGPVIAGVVGVQKFAFDIWGDTVNYASRMESTGAANTINISERTYSRIKDFFECEPRGKVLTKEKKEFDMYFVKRILPSLIDDPTQLPPPAFLRRYRIYFQKDPPAFPEFLIRSVAIA